MKKNELLNELAGLSLLEVVELYLQAKAGKELSLDSELYALYNKQLIESEHTSLEPNEDYLKHIKELQASIDLIAYKYNQLEAKDKNSPF